jgi:DNA-binding NtrC family response regulator
LGARPRAAGPGRALDGTILFADTIAAALMLAEKMRPHVLLLDVILPDGIGWEAIPDFRAVSPHTEIVVMTAMARRSDALRAVGEHGAFAYVDKCEGLDAILRTVGQAFCSTRSLAVRAAPTQRPDESHTEYVGRRAEEWRQETRRTRERLGRSIDSAVDALGRSLVDAVAPPRRR